MKIFITDCEGPITKNDNAFELCCHFIPQGERFFRILSRYDDYLAYEEKRPGYRAGNTLRFILPFLLAFGVDPQAMFPFSFRTLRVVPRAIEALRFIRSRMPVFVVSTSYEPYLKALCGLVPLERHYVYCTALRIEGLRLGPEEERRLRELVLEIASLEEGRAWRRLDELFFGELAKGTVGEIMRRVEPVGGEGKAEAVREIARRMGVGLEEVMYVGDSITDREALREVRRGGGLAVAFNPNRYALEEAEVVCLSEDAAPLAILAALFAKGGKDEVLKAVANWGEEYLLARGVPGEWISEKGEVGFVTPDTLDLWAERGQRMRERVRGREVGELG